MPIAVADTPGRRPGPAGSRLWDDSVVMVNGQATAILRWYASHARDLPWRRPDAGPWAVLVSEVMLQQTPVTRVLPAYETWLARWPTPVSLAAAVYEPTPGSALSAATELGTIPPCCSAMTRAAACNRSARRG